MNAYEKAQKLELEWWTHTNFTPHVEWSHYMRRFGMHIKLRYDTVCDVGSGPVPFICNPAVKSHLKVVVDPLWTEYAKLEKYQEWRCNIHKYHTDIKDAVTCHFDAVFCLNTLDHVQDPEDMITHLLRILKPYGHLFVFVDIDKPIDAMHSHTIRYDWMLDHLRPLTKIDLHLEKSWKFPNDVMYYVGKKIPEQRGALDDCGEPEVQHSVGDS